MAFRPKTSSFDRALTYGNLSSFGARWSIPNSPGQLTATRNARVIGKWRVFECAGRTLALAESFRRALDRDLSLRRLHIASLAVKRAMWTCSRRCGGAEPFLSNIRACCRCPMLRRAVRRVQARADTPCNAA